MATDPRLARLAPVVIPIVVVAAGWVLLVQPRFSESTSAARGADVLRQRLAGVRASLESPLPPAPAIDPATLFERDVVVGDATSRLLEQLARLAAGAPAANLLIETGERVAIGPAGAAGPRSGTAALPDPRFMLFGRELTYTPVTMSFDAEYARVGEVLWAMRDLATTVELRTFDLRPVASAPGRVRVSITLFAYARQGAAAGGATGARP